MNNLHFFQKAKRNPLWKNITNKDWYDYKWQIKNRVTDPKVLQKALGLTDKETETIQQSLKILRMAITPYYLSQIDEKDKFCRRRILPYLQPRG